MTTSINCVQNKAKAQHRFCLMKQNIHTICLNALCHCCSRKAWEASAQSFTLWQQATVEIKRSLLSSSLVSTINCSLALQALLEITHQDHSIGITLLLLVHTTYIWVLFLTHIPFVVNRTFNATPTERLQHHFGPCHAYKQKVWHILQAWHIALPECFSELIALKSKLKFCHTAPSPWEAALVGLAPLKQSSPQLKYEAL